MFRFLSASHRGAWLAMAAAHFSTLLPLLGGDRPRAACRRPPLRCCVLPRDIVVVAVTDFRLIGGVRFGVAPGRVFFGVFFFVFSCVVSFFLVPLCFKINQLWLALVFFLRLRPWSLRWGFPAFARCSLVSCLASPSALGRRLPSAWRRRVPPSRVPWSGAVCAAGRWRGRLRAWSLARGACSWLRVACLLAAASCPCSRNFF